MFLVGFQNKSTLKFSAVFHREEIPVGNPCTTPPLPSGNLTLKIPRDNDRVGDISKITQLIIEFSVLSLEEGGSRIMPAIITSRGLIRAKVRSVLK